MIFYQYLIKLTDNGGVSWLLVLDRYCVLIFGSAVLGHQLSVLILLILAPNLETPPTLESYHFTLRSRFDNFFCFFETLKLYTFTLTQKEC